LAGKRARLSMTPIDRLLDLTFHSATIRPWRWAYSAPVGNAEHSIFACVICG